MAQKSNELEQYLQRVRELENMYHRLEEALEEERQARQDEETFRKLQSRLIYFSHDNSLNSFRILMAMIILMDLMLAH